MFLNLLYAKVRKKNRICKLFKTKNVKNNLKFNQKKKTNIYYYNNLILKNYETNNSFN